MCTEVLLLPSVFRKCRFSSESAWTFVRSRTDLHPNPHGVGWSLQFEAATPDSNSCCLYLTAPASKAVDRHVIELARAGLLVAMYIGQHYDATPLQFKFGELQHEVCGFAKYFVQSDDGWECKTLDELRALRKCTSSLPATGVLELLAHAVDLGWVDQQQLVGAGKVLVPPRALQDGRASTILAALEQGASCVIQDIVRGLSDSVRFIFWCENPDGASSNRRPELAMLGQCLVHGSSIFEVLRDRLWPDGSSYRLWPDPPPWAMTLTAKTVRTAFRRIGLQPHAFVKMH